MSAELDLLRDLVFRLASESNFDEASRMLIGQHPADIAEILSQAPNEHVLSLFRAVDEELQPDVLAELDAESSTAQTLLEELSPDQLSDIVEEMSPDDAADVIGELDEQRSEAVLDLMEEEESEEVRTLLQYPEDSAGGIMTTDFTTLPEQISVQDALDKLSDIEDEKPYYYVYLTNTKQQLSGFIGLWNLLKVKDKNKTQLSDIAKRDIVHIGVETDQEEVAHVMQKYDLTAIPVVDDKNTLLGRITIDDIIDVMEEEASEDILRLAGSDESELFEKSPWDACRVRLPWLIITLFAGFIYSMIFKAFVDNFSNILLLSLFVPIVMAMGGNTGIQASTLIIRSMAIGHVNKKDIRPILFREIKVGLTMGLICGVGMMLWTFIVASVDAQPMPVPVWYLGAVVGLAFAVSMALSALFGASIPVFFQRLKIDPAVASGPLVTACTDILSLIIYFFITLLLLSGYQQLA